MKKISINQNATGKELTISIFRAKFGHILVAADQTGISNIELGDNPNEMSRDFCDRFPAHQLNKNSTPEKFTKKILDLLENPSFCHDLPLNIQGTAFQKEVWEALCKIPSGSTETYAGIAKKIGSPKAVRAVASACAANRLAIAIPCHRVIRSDGSLSGYRWGTPWKKMLLEHEGAI